MAVLNKIKRALRGEVKLTTAAREALRRSRVSLQQRKERASLDEGEPLRLTQAFARMSADELSEYFRGPRKANLCLVLANSLSGARFNGDAIRFQITCGRLITIATSS